MFAAPKDPEQNSSYRDHYLVSFTRFSYAMIWHFFRLAAARMYPWTCPAPTWSREMFVDHHGCHVGPAVPKLVLDADFQGPKCCLFKTQGVASWKSLKLVGDRRGSWWQVCTANELDTIPGPLLDRMEARAGRMSCAGSLRLLHVAFDRS